MKTIETYADMKQRHQEEVNSFEGIFFAFSNEQFYKGLESVGLSKDDNLKEHLYSIGGGGYILKSKSKLWDDMFKKHNVERKQLKNDKKLMYEALLDELINHEYCITYDANDALDALGLTVDDVDKNILKKACTQAVELCC